MYLISHANGKTIVNSTRYLVKKIRINCVPEFSLITLAGEKEVTVTFKEVAATCRYGYADTVMRVISRTIPGRFNILEASKMDRNEMFVALSRARTAASIGLSTDEDKVYKAATPPKKGGLISIKPDLFLGSLYKRTDGVLTYIGSSCDPKKREKGHQAKPVSQKVEDWQAEMGKKIKMTVLESYLCQSEQQLVRRENQLIAQVPADLCMNTKGVIKQAVAQSTTKIEACEVTYGRFKIVDSEGEKCLRISWRDNSGKKCAKKFSYKVKSRGEQMKAAEAYRAGLIKEYFQ